MTREDLFRMAREAGLAHWDDMVQAEFTFALPKRLERFAELVAAHEREACARLLDDQWFRTQSECAAAIRARGET